MALNMECERVTKLTYMLSDEQLEGLKKAVEAEYYKRWNPKGE